MTVTESDRVLAAGHQITLKDGREATVRFGFRALKKLEDEYGDLAAVFDLIDVSEDGGLKGKVFGPLFGVIAAGLTDENLTNDELDRLLDPAHLADYFSAVNAAIEEAFPAPKEQAPKARKKTAARSRGDSSTSPPQSASDGQTNSSGA